MESPLFPDLHLVAALQVGHTEGIPRGLKFCIMSLVQFFGTLNSLTLGLLRSPHIDW